MPTYIVKTPVKQMPDVKTKIVVTTGVGAPIELSEDEAEELLNVGAIEGPVDTPDSKKK